MLRSQEGSAIERERIGPEGHTCLWKYGMEIGDWWQDIRVQQIQAASRQSSGAVRQGGPAAGTTQAMREARATRPSQSFTVPAGRIDVSWHVTLRALGPIVRACLRVLDVALCMSDSLQLSVRPKFSSC